MSRKLPSIVSDQDQWNLGTYFWQSKDDKIWVQDPSLKYAQWNLNFKLIWALSKKISGHLDGKKHCSVIFFHIHKNGCVEKKLDHRIYNLKTQFHSFLLFLWIHQMEELIESKVTSFEEKFYKFTILTMQTPFTNDKFSCCQ